MLWPILALTFALLIATGVYAWANRRPAPPKPRSGPSLRLVWKELLLAAPIRLWALILAGPALSTMGALLILIIWRGGWPMELRDRQLELLGLLALIYAGLVGVIIVSLAAVKVEAETKLGKLSVGASERDDD